ncbi:hypothetical protein DNTS_025687 [Danionella cerebrum]|uniref:Uncharacterized protein n=1 Tax=Danionella cerebrum TaxID=2873325 RepID=A0A553QFG3_9TELE|nr:hypothetical protein DNTS_025687 [Danionella translucida]
MANIWKKFRPASITNSKSPKGTIPLPRVPIGSRLNLTLTGLLRARHPCLLTLSQSDLSSS